jgi:tripartite-type tricarboxylate transporter receptor subunit TctC
MLRTIVLCSSLMLSLTTTALAQYPQRPVKVIAAAAAGGGIDFQLRILTARLSERLGQQFYIENVAAAGGNLAAQTLARAEPDGYTIAMIAPAMVISHTLYVKPGYDALTDFVQVAAWAQSPLMLIANKDFQPSTVKEMAAYSSANPDKLSYGSGPGFPNHMMMELLKLESKSNIQFIPYRGQAPVLNDLLSGQIQLSMDSVASCGEFVKTGKVKGLAITSAARSPDFPDVPTIAEAGYPKITGGTWYGIVAPAKTPPEIIQKLSAEITAIQAEPAVVARIKQLGAEPLVAGADDFTKFFRAELIRWGDVIKAANLKRIE